MTGGGGTRSPAVVTPFTKEEPRKATPVRSQPDDCQQPNNPHDAAVEKPRRRAFPEPLLIKHDRVTRIHLISDAFGGTGSGAGSGGTFF